MADLNGHILVNDDEVEERTTVLKDGPLDGQRTVRPPARMRKVQHAQAFRLDDKLQPWQPGMTEEDFARIGVRFAVYLWLTSDQRYCWVDFLNVRSKEELDRALSVIAGG